MPPVYLQVRTPASLASISGKLQATWRTARSLPLLQCPNPGSPTEMAVTLQQEGRSPLQTREEPANQAPHRVIPAGLCRLAHCSGGLSGRRFGDSDSGSASRPESRSAANQSPSHYPTSRARKKLLHPKPPASSAAFSLPFSFKPLPFTRQRSRIIRYPVTQNHPNRNFRRISTMPCAVAEL